MIATTVIGNGYVSCIVVHISKQHRERPAYHAGQSARRKSGVTRLRAATPVGKRVRTTPLGGAMFTRELCINQWPIVFEPFQILGPHGTMHGAGILWSAATFIVLEKMRL